MKRWGWYVLIAMGLIMLCALVPQVNVHHGIRIPARYQGWGRLTQAIGRGDIAAVRTELANGANVNELPVLHGAERGAAPLSVAAGAGQLDCAGLLLDRGANPNIEDDIYGTPLTAAAKEGHLDLMRLLLHRGAQVADARGHSAARCEAAAAGRHEAVALLLAHGASPNQTEPCGGTLLSEVDSRGDRQMADMLRKAGAR